MRIFRANDIGELAPIGIERDRWVECLSARLQIGDESAFRDFFEAYADRLFRFCIVLTRGNEDLSRDLLQQSMIKCARGMPRFSSERSLWAWLSKVARNGYIDHLRRESGRSFQAEWVATTLETESDDKETELMEALQSTLEELPSEEQRLLNAIYEQRLSHKKVAELANTTPKAVENKLCRLRSKLRQAIMNKLKAYAIF
ncbi:MAG: RNA polymerase sigma factor [Verrucomicrobiales bacterium]